MSFRAWVQQSNSVQDGPLGMLLAFLIWLQDALGRHGNSRHNLPLQHENSVTAQLSGSAMVFVRSCSRPVMPQQGSKPSPFLQDAIKDEWDSWQHLYKVKIQQQIKVNYLILIILRWLCPKNVLVFGKYTQKQLGRREHHIYHLLSNGSLKSVQRENGKIIMVNVNIWGN